MARNNKLWRQFETPEAARLGTYMCRVNLMDAEVRELMCHARNTTDSVSRSQLVAEARRFNRLSRRAKLRMYILQQRMVNHGQQKAGSLPQE